MAEVVGLIASVLQLIETLAQARRYFHNFHEAPNEQQRLLLEIQNLHPLIRELDRRLLDYQAAGRALGLQEFSDPLLLLKGIMERLTGKLNSTGMSKFYSRLAWPLWGKEDVQDGLNTIERFKSLLNAWMGMDIWNSTQDVLSALEHTAQEQRIDHNYIAQSVRSVARNQERYQNSAKRNEIIEWYSPLNFFLRQADIFNTRQPGTGRWLLEDEAFKAWESGTTKILWCPGMPGAGKTVLASIVVDHLRTNRASQDTGVAVLYLNHKETEVQSPSNLLAGLWRQLVLEKSLPLAVDQLYAKHREPCTRPSLEQIQAVLRSIISQYSEIFIVVDALDEYPEKQRDVLLRCLWALGQNVNLMLTSRPHVNIDNVVGNANIEALKIRATEDDVRQHIDGQILKPSRLSKHIQNCPSLRNEIERRIVRRSDGMFLLAKLHLDSLATKHTVKAVRDALDKLPSDLNNTYNEVLNRIDRQSEDDRNLARRALSWISNAKRLLRTSELREALAVEQGSTKLDPDNLMDIETILSVCAGLVIVDEENELVRLIHYTAQDYLERIQAYAFPRAQTEITTTCITYLGFDIFHQNAFLDYAVHYSLIHARGQPELDIRPLLLSFLADCSEWRKLWNWRHPFEKLPGSASALWIAAVFFLDETCRYLIQEGGTGGVLQEASVEGLTDVVRILVDNGANVNANEGDNATALLTASARGHDDIIRLLLEHNVNIDFRGKNGTALQVAAYSGHARTVHLLIQGGADVNAEGGRYGTALYAAATQGKEKMLHLLLKNGAAVNRLSGSYGTPLCGAIRRSSYETTRALLHHGADVNSEIPGDGTVLQRASFRGCEAIVRLLLEHGADANLKTGGYGPPLYIASDRGHYTIVRLLIDHGAEVNGSCHNALQVASREGHEPIVRLLVEHGADINASGGWYGSALQAAASAGHAKIVKRLIEDGADINARGGRYGSALQAAASARRTSIVRLLIAHGADINAKGGRYGR
ncbi:ankyrin repeat-containing domain protein [Mycena latifolia]|nr:ankyrin repeat-containing domain protein [Mycena latifolia]